MNIAGSSAFVTGAGSGIGRALALLLAERGAAHVTVADLDAASAEETVRLIADSGGRAGALRLDVTDTAALEAAIAATVATHSLDIMINNAGIIGGPPAFPAMTMARIEQMIAVNLTATIAGSKFAIEQMQARGHGGAILVTASRASLVPSRADPVYTATKAGILMFVRSCRELAAECGIRVNAICPGVTATGMLALTGGDEPADWLQQKLEREGIMTAEHVAGIGIGLIEDDSKAGDYALIENDADR